MSNTRSTTTTKAWRWGQKTNKVHQSNNATTPFGGHVTPQASDKTFSTTGVEKTHTTNPFSRSNNAFKSNPNPFIVSRAHTERRGSPQSTSKVHFTNTSTHQSWPWGQATTCNQEQRSINATTPFSVSPHQAPNTKLYTTNEAKTPTTTHPFSTNNNAFNSSPNPFVASSASTEWRGPPQHTSKDFSRNTLTATTHEPRPDGFNPNNAESPGINGFFVESKRSVFPSGNDFTQSTSNVFSTSNNGSKDVPSFSKSFNPFHNSNINNNNSATMSPSNNLTSPTDEKQTKSSQNYTDQSVGVSFTPSTFLKSTNNDKSDIGPILYRRGESLDHAFAVALDQLNRASHFIVQAVADAATATAAAASAAAQQKDKKRISLDNKQQVEQLLTESFHAFRCISDYALWRDGQPHATAFYNMACCLSLAVELQVIMSQQDGLIQMLNIYGNALVSDIVASNLFAVPSLFQPSKDMTSSKSPGSSSTTLKESMEQRLRACDGCLKVAVAAGWNDLAYIRADRDLKVYLESMDLSWMTKLAPVV